MKLRNFDSEDYFDYLMRGALSSIVIIIIWIFIKLKLSEKLFPIIGLILTIFIGLPILGIIQKYLSKLWNRIFKKLRCKK